MQSCVFARIIIAEIFNMLYCLAVSLHLDRNLDSAFIQNDWKIIFAGWDKLLLTLTREKFGLSYVTSRLTKQISTRNLSECMWQLYLALMQLSSWPNILINCNKWLMLFVRKIMHLLLPSINIKYWLFLMFVYGYRYITYYF